MNTISCFMECLDRRYALLRRMRGRGCIMGNRKYLAKVSVASLLSFGMAIYANAQGFLHVVPEDFVEPIWQEVAERATRVTTGVRTYGADEKQGEGILESFGVQYMPNTYAKYESVREKAKEREKVFLENFPNGEAPDPKAEKRYSAFGAAVEVAKIMGITVVAMTGRRGGRLRHLSDVSVCVPADSSHTIQEFHLPIYHMLCLAAENEFFGA